MLSSKGNKGFAFVNFIASRYARRTGEGPSQAEGPSPEGPLAIWHKPQLARTASYSRHPTASRGPDASAITCKKVPDGAFLVRSANSDRNAHIHLAHSCSQNMNCTFAHMYRFKDSVPPERYERRPVRVVPIQNGCRPDDFCFHRSGGMYVLNLKMCAKVHVNNRLHVRATTPYARFDRCLRGSRANRKSSPNFFACFGWPNIVRAKP